MADTCEIPERPQAHLSACTTAELSTYEQKLKRAFPAAHGHLDRTRIASELRDVEEQWDERGRITPGHAGRTWPMTNST